MGFDMDIDIYKVELTHENHKVCFKYDCEPDKDDLFTHVCDHFNNGDVPWKSDEVHAIMAQHTNSDQICKRCRFFTRNTIPLDSRHIQHAYSNHILDSKWFLKKLDCITIGNTSELFHSEPTLLFEIQQKSLHVIIETLETAKNTQQTSYMRTSDKEAINESLETLRWIQGWFDKDPTIVVLVSSDI